MTDYFLDESKLLRLLGSLRRGTLYGTVQREDRSLYEKISDQNMERLTVRVPPPVESLKGFLFPIKERVALYPSAGDAGPEEDLTESEPQLIVGARACDLCALEILEQVFVAGDFTDPFFERRRRCSIVITTDCVEPAEGCFCNLVGGKPFPDGGFDLNLSPIKDGYVVAIGSDAGKELVLDEADLMDEASSEQLAERDALRKAVSTALEEKNAEFRPKRPLEELTRNQPKEKWLKLAASCVECGACTYSCPTCHCFLLYDQPADDAADRSERLKTWDSCILANYAKMAGVGGMKASPRPELRSRFENRIRHKFEWMPENLERFGCVGCGRCIEGCMGGSDIRDVIKEFGQ